VTYLLVKKVKSAPQIMQLTTVLPSAQGCINCLFASKDLKPGPGPVREVVPAMAKEFSLDPEVVVG